MSNYISTQIDRVIDSDHNDPFQVLGLHFIDQEPRTALVRTFQPHAESVQIVINEKKQYMYKMREEGLFEIELPEFSEPFPYYFEIQYNDKTVHTTASTPQLSLHSFTTQQSGLESLAKPMRLQDISNKMSSLLVSIALGGHIQFELFKNACSPQTISPWNSVHFI